MRLIPSDPDIETVVGRIDDHTIDLSPDFQRGAVWAQPKQRLLIDSVLRNWYIPPVHVVRTDEDEQEVLDGQQRLRAIHDFVKGKFTVDGDAEPLADDIQALSGLHYSDLPEKTKRRFDRFTVRVFEVVDYEPEEPYELFFRLNQPTTLTSAEKRNAFFGRPREQVRELTELAQSAGMSSQVLGFSNARMAYEDIVARFVWVVDQRSLADKVTASRVTQMYRSGDPIPAETVAIVEPSLEKLFKALAESGERLNRALIHSWLCVVARSLAHRELGPLGDSLAKALTEVEARRREVRTSESSILGVHALALAVLTDRATSRVNDVSSVVLRDACIWMEIARAGYVPESALRWAFQSIAPARSVDDVEAALYDAATAIGWPRLLL